MKARHWWSIAVVVLAIVCIGSAFQLVTVAPNAIAASDPFSEEAQLGGGAIAFCPSHQTDPHCIQDAHFIALKEAGRILSGIPQGGLPKGTRNAIVVLPAPMAGPAAAHVGNMTAVSAQRGMSGASAQRSMNSTGRWGNCNDCYELDETNVWNVFEPSNGKSWQANFGQNTPRTDDNCRGIGCSGTLYCTNPNDDSTCEQYFADLCGPGAADVTLWYWPQPPNTETTSTTEPILHRTTIWKGYDPYDGVLRMRGYMMALAYTINPGWPYNGMQQNGSATVDWAMREGLNWEASGHSGKNYFYVFGYPDSSGNTKLRNNLNFDLTGSHVPIVALLNATYLPNWSPGGTVGHWISIIGYNNDNSQYAYVDTCGYWTYCNHSPSNTDGQVHVVDQQTLFNGILSYGNEWIW